MARGDQHKAHQGLLYGIRQRPQRRPRPTSPTFCSLDDILEEQLGWHDPDIEIFDHDPIVVDISLAQRPAALFQDGQDRAIVRMAGGGLADLRLMLDGEVSDLRRALESLHRRSSGEIFYECDFEEGTSTDELAALAPLESWHLLGQDYVEPRSEAKLIFDLAGIKAKHFGALLKRPDANTLIAGQNLDLALPLSKLVALLPERS